MSGMNKGKQEVLLVVSAIAAVVALAGTVLLNEQVRTAAGVYAWELLGLPDAALALNPDPVLSKRIADYYFNVSGVHRDSYDVDAAQKYYLYTLQKNDRYPRAWFQLGRTQFLKGNFYSALFSLKRELAVTGDDIPSVYYMLGLTYGYADNIARAQEYFRKYLEYDPMGWYTYNDLAWLAFKDDDYERAAQLAREGLKYNPDNAWLLLSLGASLINLDEKEEARDVLKRAQTEANQLTVYDWGRAYPGNDPAMYPQGLAELRQAIEQNLQLAVE
jgi:tetratricopeptide (TPR) repeat protein